MSSSVGVCLQSNLHKAGVIANSFHLALCGEDKDPTVITFLPAIMLPSWGGLDLPQLTTQASFLRHSLPIRTERIMTTLMLHVN